jgi:predicted ATPase
MKDEQLPKPAVKLKMNRRRVKQEKKRRRQKDHMNTVLSEKRGEKQSQVETEYLWEKKDKWEQQCDKSAALDIHGKTKKGIHKRYICS